MQDPKCRKVGRRKKYRHIMKFCVKKAEPYKVIHSLTMETEAAKEIRNIHPHFARFRFHSLHAAFCSAEDSRASCRASPMRSSRPVSRYRCFANIGVLTGACCSCIRSWKRARLAMINSGSTPFRIAHGLSNAGTMFALTALQSRKKIVIYNIILLPPNSTPVNILHSWGRMSSFSPPPFARCWSFTFSPPSFIIFLSITFS